MLKYDENIDCKTKIWKKFPVNGMHNETKKNIYLKAEHD